MILGALVDAGLEFDDLKNELSKVPLDGYRLQQRRVLRQLIAGTKIDVIVQTASGREIIEGPGDQPHIDDDRPHDHRHARHLGDLISITEASTLDP